MQAVVYERFGEVPTVATVADPPCPPAGALIEVRATGLCRSDWHAWMGHDDGVALPHVPGHELAGVVAEVGPEVTRWRVGDAVTVPFVCACGTCPSCRHGDGQVCERQTQPGFTHWGSFAELVAIEHADVNLVRLPDGMAFETAASLGCRFATAWRAVRQLGRPEPGDWLAVYGCGGVGLSAVMVAAAAGARVIAVDISAGALELARGAGAAYTLDASGGSDVPEQVVELTKGGAAVSIDALGSAATCSASIRSLRRRGRHVQVGLLLGADASPGVPMGRVISHELEVLGAHGLDARAYPEMLAEIAAGTLAPQQLVTATIGLDAAGPALAAMGELSPVGITMIEPYA
jgi:D-arabinose 1-dehydrogenase-like Zn-dependent alcohol dehydrogenase